MPNRSQAWAAALLVAVFLAGGAAGYWYRDYTGERPEPRLRETAAMVTYLTHELGLNAAEQESVRVVLERHRAEVNAAWEAAHPRFDSLRSVMEAEISARLRPIQEERYRALIARLARQRVSGDTTTTADHH
jgi:hypothetical protein